MEKGKRMAVVLDDVADEDQIGYDEYSEGLVEMIRSVGAKAEKGSFTIGVFGQWGQGKTSMLRQIENWSKIILIKLSNSLLPCLRRISTG